MFRPRLTLIGFPPAIGIPITEQQQPLSETSNAGKILAAARSTYRAKFSETTAQLMLERGGL